MISGSARVEEEEEEEEGGVGPNTSEKSKSWVWEEEEEEDSGMVSLLSLSASLEWSVFFWEVGGMVTFGCICDTVLRMYVYLIIYR